MKVITGSAKGASIKTLAGLDVRPTCDKIKGAVFNGIQFDINQNSRVLDLFAGSGSLGVEALSRGAGSAYFIDKNAAALSIVKENLIKTKLIDKAVLLNKDYKAFIKDTDKIFDIAFLDPPYDIGILPEIINITAEKMSDDGIIIAESNRKEELPGDINGFYKTKEYIHGIIKITIYKKGD